MDLSQFTGSERYFKHWTGMMYTTGIQYVAEQGGAYWLLDAIASYQPDLRKKPRLAEFQVWELKVKDHKAVLTCKGDSGEKPVVTQHIEFTDFPLPYIKIYVEDVVILLTSEH